MEDFDIEELEQMMSDGWVECDCCGDRIELDGVCSEGTPSPFLTMGLI